MANALPNVFASWPQVSIFCGALGSGKTTLALNVAWRLASGREKVYLVDLDVINPLFRSRRFREKMAPWGVEVIAPPPTFDLSDLPALPAAIKRLLAGEERVVVDVGGDGVGATVLGAYSSYLPPAAGIFLVVNACRPFSSTVEEVVRAAQEIAQAGRVELTGLINNTHLGEATTVEVVREGWQVVEEAGRILGLPVVFSALREDLIRDDLPFPVFPLKLFPFLPWQSVD
ncbi:putative ATP/GTP-binding protein [Ammonifex degensii KC4]|uniref:ATP/GTP-binding protein n=1 Tax=Ammonifex degensii (strain DSM 10501 / KC4) TaxID=429009 RepID=C9R860_AMMDK|nr:putative ATP/GTP-binding protein [Ammonifex degensii]ACX52489.1 putative ATP/GTP-binding protein [Ammonifex degensii KC4]